MYRKWYKSFRKCWFWQRTSSDMHMMRHASKNTQNLDEQMMLLNQVSWIGMLGTTLDYLAQIRPPAITIEAFPRNESDRAQFSKLQCKRLPPNGEAIGYPWLLFLAWKIIIFCYCCTLFSSGYPLATLINTSSSGYPLAYLSPLQVLRPYLLSDHGGIWPERRY